MNDQWRKDQSGWAALNRAERRVDLDSRLGEALREINIGVADVLMARLLCETLGGDQGLRIDRALQAIDEWLRNDGAPDQVLVIERRELARQLRQTCARCAVEFNWIKKREP